MSDLRSITQKNVRHQRSDALEKALRPRPVAFCYLARALRESYPGRNLKYVADELNVGVGYYAKWEKVADRGGLLYEHLTRLQDVYGMPPGISLAICDMVELAITKNDGQLGQYARVLQGLASRLFESKESEDSIADLVGRRLEEGETQAYEALVDAFLTGSQAVSPTQRLAFRNLERKDAKKRGKKAV